VTFTAFAGIQPVDLPAIVAATRTGFFFELRAFLRRFRFVCERTQAASFFAPDPIRDFARFDILGFRFFAITKAPLELNKHESERSKTLYPAVAEFVEVAESHALGLLGR
jgi:hypothetical protein